MVKIEVRGAEALVDVSGSLVDTTRELLVGIHAYYSATLARDAEEAEAVYSVLRDTINDEELWGIMPEHIEPMIDAESPEALMFGGEDA